MNAERDGFVADIMEAMEPVMRKAIREEVPAVLAEAMTPDAAREFWSVGLDVMREKMQDRAGKWLLGRAGKVFSNLVWLLLGAAILYQIAGWPAAKWLWSAVASKNGN